MTPTTIVSTTTHRLDEYCRHIVTSLGHKDRHQPCIDYLYGLLMPGHRKSMEPIAARIAPQRTSAKHQALQHFISESSWDEQKILESAVQWALPAMEASGGISAWIIDDTGMAKCGTESVGVARQYCGNLGKTDNCQVAVSLSFANAVMSVPVSWQLYLPENWANDEARRRKCKVPKDTEFRTKWQIAIDEIDRQITRGVPHGTILADAGYGTITAFRDKLSVRNLSYIVGTTGEVGVWSSADQQSTDMEARSESVKVHRESKEFIITVAQLAASLPSNAWKTVTWREGSNGTPLKSRFSCQRVRPSHGHHPGRDKRPEIWLLMEWPEGESAPTSYAFSNLPINATLEHIVRTYKLRWRIEHDYLEMKDQLGLDHFEGRSWRGFHHHGALCIAAYCFVAVERATIFPPPKYPILQSRSRKTTIPRGSPKRGTA